MPKFVDTITPQTSSSATVLTRTVQSLPSLASTITAKTISIEKLSDQQQQQQQQLTTQQQQLKQRKKTNKQPMGKLVNMVVCSCGKRFEYIWSLTYHKKWECGQELKCEYCNTVFTDISFLILRRHRELCLKRL